MYRLFPQMLLTAVAFLLCAAPASAQLETANKGALLFNYGGLFSSTPAAFDTVGIGGRYFIDRNLAIRGALGIGLTTAKVESDNAGANETTDETSLYSLEGGVEYVLARTKTAYLYTGGILQLSSAENDPEGGNNNTTTTGAAVAGLIGANYFVADGLSIGAEYRLGFAYSSVEQQGNDVTSTNTSIGTGTVGFHLGFWFD